MIEVMLTIETQAVEPFFKNGFLVSCDETREAVLIDPGEEVNVLLGLAERANLMIRHILLTHAHIDHISGVAAAKRALNAPVYLHESDLFLYQHAAEQGAMFGVSVEALPDVDVFYTPGLRIPIGQYEVRPHHTPGHSPGGVCLQIGNRDEPGKHLFVGDTLFAGSIGRTDLLGGDYRTLLQSITTVLFSFEDDAQVHPGHGPITTIGEERRSNPFLKGVT
jgi:hydroxyacylglutathione hydrolase